MKNNKKGFNMFNKQKKTKRKNNQLYFMLMRQTKVMKELYQSLKEKLKTLIC